MADSLPKQRVFRVSFSFALNLFFINFCSNGKNTIVPIISFCLISIVVHLYFLFSQYNLPITYEKNTSIFSYNQLPFSNFQITTTRDTLKYAFNQLFWLIMEHITENSSFFSFFFLSFEREQCHYLYIYLTLFVMHK